MGLCLIYGKTLTGGNSFFHTAVSAALAAGLALLLAEIGLGASAEAVTIGTLMVLVPGMALTSAMREIMAGDILSGLERTAEVILTASAIALGTALPLALEETRRLKGAQPCPRPFRPACGPSWPAWGLAWCTISRGGVS